MRVHFLGMGGSGASAAAAIAEAQGYEITGCDLEPHNEFTTQFKNSKLFKGHSPKHLENTDILAVTPAIFSLDPSNPELLSAKQKGIPTITWQQFLGKYLAKNKFVIAVAGTHGKTTTTAMIAKLLEDGGLDPTVELGAIVPWWKTNFRVGKGKYFVVEAEEYNDNFLSLKPDISVVTNMEMDHPEYFKDFEAVKSSFRKFLQSTKQTIIANLSDPGVATTNPVGRLRKTYGVEVIDYSKKLIDFPLKVPGQFNRWNASAAFQMGLALGIDPGTIQKSLSTYSGIGRRFEYIGKFKGAEIYSDFGHHPTEIRVTMEAVRERFPKNRTLLVYQPHMFSRTRALFDDFVKVLREISADKTFIMDIYPSREKDSRLVSSIKLVEAVNKDSVIYIGPTNQTLDKLKPQIQKGDVIFFMSAGDTDKLAKELAYKVLIFGLGLNQGGVGSAKFFAKQDAQVRVTDLKSAQVLKPSLDQLKQFKNIKYTLGQHKYEDIDWADLIIKNPAVKPFNPYIEYAQKQGKQVEMDMGIFLKFVKPSQIIGVTGTKGKSTTASLIYEILKKRAGVKLIHPPGGIGGIHSYPRGVILAGNIGKSVLDTISHVRKDTLVVLEISSFQLESFAQHQVSPKWAVITNITPDHLNYYQTMEEYVTAKKIIGKYQTNSDYLFLRKKDPITSQKNFLKRLKGKIIYFSKDDLPKNFQPILLGEHNEENMAAALAIAKVFAVSQKTTLDALSHFRGIPYRLELIKTWHGVKIYNDTTATGPDAGIQALKTFPGCTLIAGGMNKNMSYNEYAKALDKYAKKVFFLIGDSTERIKGLMKRKDKVAGTYDNLKKLLKDVKSQVKPGDTILFSPAATSFNLFQNEFDRGRKFNQAVKKVFP